MNQKSCSLQIFLLALFLSAGMLTTRLANAAPAHCGFCGNGIVELALYEQCDPGAPLPTTNCELAGTQYFPNLGSLSCHNVASGLGCTFDTSNCKLINGQPCTVATQCASNYCNGQCANPPSQDPCETGGSWTFCNGVLTELCYSFYNCGSCGHSCGAGQGCNKKQCRCDSSQGNLGCGGVGSCQYMTCYL